MASISICICTRDRANSLRKTLESVCSEIPPRVNTLEVLVVDNGSRDKTQAVINSAAIRDQRVRRVHEPCAGLSRARNTAIRHANGEVIVFIDDDVQPLSGWFEAITQPILRGEADAVAGRIALSAEFHRPWLSERFRLLFAETPPPGPGPPPLIGANMAFSAAVSRAVSFDEELGPGKLGMADDVLFYYQVQDAGFRIADGERAKVVHFPDPKRLEPEALRQLATMNGRSHAYIWHHWLSGDSRLLRARRLDAWRRLVLSRVTAIGKSGLSEREYDALQRLSFLRQLQVEQRRIPRYGRARSVP